MNGNLKPFRPAQESLPARAVFISWMMKTGRSRSEAAEVYEKMLLQEVFRNDEYQVNIDRNPPHGFPPAMEIWQLTVNRLDGKAVHDWRDLQAIKNELVGPEYDAVELYPAEKRLMDTTNSFHLFVFIRDRALGTVPELPFGWTERKVGSAKEALAIGCTQRDPPETWKPQ